MHSAITIHSDKVALLGLARVSDLLLPSRNLLLTRISNASGDMFQTGESLLDNVFV